VPPLIHRGYEREALRRQVRGLLPPRRRGWGRLRPLEKVQRRGLRQVRGQQVQLG